MLKQRVITAAWLLPLALFGFFGLTGAWFSLFVAVVLALGAWEWANLAGFKQQVQRVIYAAILLAAFLGLVLWPQRHGVVLWLAVIWWGVATLMVAKFPSSVAWWGGLWGKSLMGWLILLPAGIGLIQLKSLPQGNMLILSVMLLVWAADIGAYFSGRAFGQSKLAPKVSPGKSWAGVYGGLTASVLVGFALTRYFQLDLPQTLLAVVITVLIVAVSIIGDLTESMFKRQADVKDSSQLLPGHGGVLDRIDSLTAAVPLFALVLALAGWGV